MSVVQTEVTILDEAKQMAYGVKLLGHLSVNINGQIERTITRDPGTFVEIVLSKDVVPVNINFSMPLNNPDELEKALENPQVVAQIESLMKEATKNYVFPEVKLVAAPVEGDTAATEAEAKTTSKK